MIRRSPRVAALLFVLIVLPNGWASAPATGKAQPTPHSRFLPLNHFNFQSDGIVREGPYRELATAVGDDYFDGTSDVARVRRHFQIARVAGVKFLRCAFSWDAIEKSPGTYDWKFWDMLVQESQSAHIELIPYVAYTPRWAAVKQEEFWSQPPRDPMVYANFMRTIAARYRGKIRVWEIWNEPDNKDYWQGSVEGFAQLVKDAAVELRKADPSLVLVLGGMSRGPGTFFQTLMADYQIAGYVDVIAMHAYPESWGEERAETSLIDWLQQMAAIVQREGLGDDFWLNEMGYADYRYRPNEASKWGTSVYYDYEHTPEYQAAFLLKAELMALAVPQVSLTMWYRIDDFSPSKDHFSDDEVNYHLGLVDAEGRLKPDFYALKFFDTLFNKPAMPLHETIDGAPGSQAVLAVFRTIDRKIIVAGWLRSSKPSEVSNRSGELHDAREETLAVQLPCKDISEGRSFDPEGHPQKMLVEFQQGWLRQIHLRGDRLFLAQFTCAN